MKIFNKIFFLQIIGLFLLLGCIESVDEEVVVQQDEKEFIVCEDLKYPENQTNCQENVQPYIVRILADEIYASFDIERCDELPGEKAQDCKDYILNSGVKGPLTKEAMTAFIDAVSYADNSKCDLLPSKDLISFCKQKHVESAESAKMMEILRSNDISKCDELAVESIKNECKEIIQIKQKTQ